MKTQHENRVHLVGLDANVVSVSLCAEVFLTLMFKTHVESSYEMMISVPVMFLIFLVSHLPLIYCSKSRFFSLPLHSFFFCCNSHIRQICI